MATVSFHLRQGRCRKVDAARELVKRSPRGVLPRRTLQHRLKLLVAKEPCHGGERRRRDTASRRAGPGVGCCGHLE